MLKARIAFFESWWPIVCLLDAERDIDAAGGVPDKPGAHDAVLGTAIRDSGS
jgi:hypothetical protein